MTPVAAQAYPDLIARAQERAVMVVPVDDDAMAALSDTVHPQGLVATARHVDVGLTAALESAPPLCAVLADVRDPGNAGTVIRTSDAAGAGAVVLTGEVVDPYNPKAVRASVGSLFHLPVVIEPSVVSVVSALRAAGLRVLAADGSATMDLDAAETSGLLAGPTAWVFGNEAWGLPEATLALADDVVRVPIYGHAESLNLATAAAVCLYASARAQRGSGLSAAGQR